LQAALHTLFFKADTAKAFRSVLAGFALTFISSPNIKRVPAFVAALCFVLIMQIPGIVNLPVPFTSLPPIVAKSFKNFTTSDFSWPHVHANESAISPFGMAFLATGADMLIKEEELVSQQGRLGNLRKNLYEHIPQLFD